VGGHALLVGLLPGGGLGLQPGLGLPQPGQPPRLAGQRRWQLVPAGVAEQPVLVLVGLGRLAQDLGDLASILSWVRLALSAVLPASLVPSRATVPTCTMPAAAHSFSEATRKPARACSWRARNRAIVTWSGVWLPASTRKATSSWQRRSSCREDRTPLAYAYSSTPSSIVGS
jgi:hypothetical protein